MGKNENDEGYHRYAVRNPVVTEFIRGLELLESEREAGDLLKLFAGNCRFDNVMLDEPLAGIEGARRFWHDYRQTFNEVTSTFGRITEVENVAVLEWTSEGVLKTGRPISYRGASVLVMDNNLIVDFMAYFDSRHFSAHI